MSNREEFQKKCPVPLGTTYNEHHDQYDICDEHGELCDQVQTYKYRIWQAATYAADARYHGRIKELEEALRAVDEFLLEAQCIENMQVGTLTKRKIVESRKVIEALSTTTPDTTLQRIVLEARIDERRRADGFDSKMVEDLQLQLAALGE